MERNADRHSLNYEYINRVQNALLDNNLNMNKKSYIIRDCSRNVGD